MGAAAKWLTPEPKLVTWTLGYRMTQTEEGERGRHFSIVHINFFNVSFSVRERRAYT